MLFVNLKTAASRETVMKILADTRDMAKPDGREERLGKPTMILTEKGEKIKVSCRYIGGASQDYGRATYFVGRLREKDGNTTLRGMIITEPLFHIPFIALFIFFIYRCITLGAFNVVPVCLALFCFLMFRSEYAKQPRIRRYLRRAFRIADRIENEK